MHCSTMPERTVIWFNFGACIHRTRPAVQIDIISHTLKYWNAFMPIYEANIGHIIAALNDVKGKECEIIADTEFKDILKKCSNSHISFKTKNIDEARIQSCRAAIVYNSIKNVQESDKNLTDYQKTLHELNIIRRRSKKLSEALKSVSDQTRDVLSVADNIVENEIWRDSKNISESHFGHPIHRSPSADGEPSVSYWTIHNIAKMIEVFSNISNQSEKWHFPPTKGGRPSDEATKMFVSNLRGAWELISDATFTFVQHKGEPTSYSAIFCWEILRLVDPQAQFSSLSTAMKKVAKYSGAKPGRPSSTSKTKKLSKTLE
jgi:hypothetical protein